MNSNLLTETTLNGSLEGIVTNLKTLMDSFWIYIVIALAAVVVVWGAYVGIKIAIAHKNEDKINARDILIFMRFKKFFIALTFWFLTCIITLQVFCVYQK